MAGKAPAYEPPPDPDFEQLAHEGYAAWKRDQPTVVAFDTETTGLAHFDVPFCATIAWRPIETQESASYETRAPIQSHYFELDKLDNRDMVREILGGAEKWVGHNLKFDLQKAILGGLIAGAPRASMIEDTQVLAHLLDEHRLSGLKELVVSVLGYEDIIEVPYASGEKAKQGLTRPMPREKYEIEQAKKWAKREYGIASVRDVGYHLLPRGVIVPYAVKDALWTLELFELFRPQVTGDLLGCYEQEMALTLVLLDMEHAGMRLDLGYVQAAIQELTKTVARIDIRIQEVTGKPVGRDEDQFNPASNPQIAEFFRAAGHDHEKYDKSVLSSIEHPLAPLLLERRKSEKLLSTYFQAMKKEQQDGILHPSYRQNVSTGRMSSGKETG